MKKPADTRFRQQQLKAWQPVLTPRWVISTYTITGFLFVIIGIVLLSASESTLEFSTRYDKDCSLGSTCEATIDVKEDMQAPVYFYYRLSNFYQNHRRYVKSRSDVQLRGTKGDKLTWGDIESCDPLRAENGVKSEKNEKEWYYPCGLIANSNFNDKLDLHDLNNNSLELNKKDIVWASDRDYKFKQPENYDNATAFPYLAMPNVPAVDDPDFIVWMRTAALPTFRKLYGVIDQKLPKGKYVVYIENNFEPAFEGEKQLVLANVNWSGAKNSFLGTAYLIVGLFCLIAALIFFLKHKGSPRDLADPSLLDWNK